MKITNENNENININNNTIIYIGIIRWKQSIERRINIIKGLIGIIVNKHSSWQQIDWHARRLWWIDEVIKVRFKWGWDLAICSTDLSLEGRKFQRVCAAIETSLPVILLDRGGKGKSKLDGKSWIGFRKGVDLSNACDYNCFSSRKKTVSVVGNTTWQDYFNSR